MAFIPVNRLPALWALTGARQEWRKVTDEDCRVLTFSDLTGSCYRALGGRGDTEIILENVIFGHNPLGDRTVW